MPFITLYQRANPDMTIPGDRCFSYYLPMMEKWRAERRWTTADSILKSMIPDDMKRAEVLAFLVFFIREIMIYEEEKAKENGEI
jgi:hypothetical protein